MPINLPSYTHKKKKHSSAKKTKEVEESCEVVEKRKTVVPCYSFDLKGFCFSNPPVKLRNAKRIRKPCVPSGKARRKGKCRTGRVKDL